MKTIIKGKNAEYLKSNPRAAVHNSKSCNCRDLPCSGNRR